MADVTVKSFDELESPSGRFLHAGKGLGVTAFGINIQKYPAGYDEYPDHDHAGDGQEEVYVVIDGSATLTADGDSCELQPGTIAEGFEPPTRGLEGPPGVRLLSPPLADSACSGRISA